jgi:hypothetical protein
MITAKLIGGLGNNMFQYAIARIIADQKQCNLLVEGIDTLTKVFPNAVNITDRIDLCGNVLEVGYKSEEKYLHHINMSKISSHNGPINIEGFFQKYELYKNHKSTIKNWFSFDESGFKKPTKKDLIIHHRLGDYVRLNWQLFPEDVMKIIKNNNIEYENCYIVTDDPSNKILNSYNINAIILKQTELEDLTFMKYANQLIISHSSFSWWAAFLGNQNKIYTPMGNGTTPHIWKVEPRIDDIDLIPNTNKYIKQDIIL